MLTLLRPHMAAAYTRAANHSRAESLLRACVSETETRGCAVIAISRRGAVLFCSDAATELLRRYLPQITIRAGRRLPEELRLAAHRSFAEFRQNGRTLRCKIAATGGAFSIINLREQPLQTESAPLEQAFHLTPREGEVLRWVAQGKRNSEIAVICGLSCMTIESYVKRLFEKLTVETRSAATACAWEIWASN
jgi:DNA-binding CsgD family transcriptional regulator/predicted DCC family thiol-disulfide oxidoreductase YuxK